MSEKSVQKRNYIIEKAREVFSQKGYLTVTMKDIVEACEISREMCIRDRCHGCTGDS